MFGFRFALLIVCLVIALFLPGQVNAQCAGGMCAAPSSFDGGFSTGWYQTLPQYTYQPQQYYSQPSYYWDAPESYAAYTPSYRVVRQVPTTTWRTSYRSSYWRPRFR